MPASRCAGGGAIDFTRDATAQTERFDLVLDLRSPTAYAHLFVACAAAGLPALGRRDLGIATLCCASWSASSRSPFLPTNKALRPQPQRKPWAAMPAWTSARPRPSPATRAASKSAVNPNPRCGLRCLHHRVPHRRADLCVPQCNGAGHPLKTLLSTYAAAGGKDAVVLLHSQERGQSLVGRTQAVLPS